MVRSRLHQPLREPWYSRHPRTKCEPERRGTSDREDSVSARAAILVALIAMIAPVSEAQRGNATVSGVIEGEANAPLAACRVSVIRGGENEATAETLTNERGEFVFRNLLAGQYRITADCSGYVHSEYGQRSFRGKGVSVNVESAGAPLGLRITPTRSGVISGRITNSRGEPLGNADVVAFKTSVRDAQRNLSAVRAVRTNDSGEYRIFVEFKCSRHQLCPGVVFPRLRIFGVRSM